MKKYISVAIIIIILLIFIWIQGWENFENIQPDSYVKLYQDFNQKTEIFEFKPLLNDPDARYFRGIIRGNIRSIDLNLPKKNDGLDQNRFIEIYSMYGGDNISSEVSTFYNFYTGPDWVPRVNGGIFKLLTKLKAGSRIRLNLDYPVNRVFIYCRI